MTNKEVFEQIVNLLKETRIVIDQNSNIYENDWIDVESLYYKLEEIEDEIEGSIN